MATALFSGIENYNKLISQQPTIYSAWGITAAALGIIGNQSVAWYESGIGIRINSLTLLADAKHSWLDALSSMGVLTGLLFVALGYRLGNPIAGSAILLFIIHIGYELTEDVIYHLMDGIEVEHFNSARISAERASEHSVSDVRGGWMGRSLILELEVAVPTATSLAESTALADRVRTSVLDNVLEATHMNVTTRPDTVLSDEHVEAGR